jgi:Uma2 family endonuclease
VLATPNPPRLTAQEYLAWESQQEYRHELADGIPIAMTSGSLAHNDLAIRLLGYLLPHVKNCRINLADAKLQINDTTYRYPDLMVSCDDRDRTATDALHHPKLIVEVLSPGTAARDRGEKLHEYRSIASLQEYLLIETQQILVEIYRRSPSRFWLYDTYTSGETLHLDSLDLDLVIDDLYSNIAIG